ncbi:hypothetical protein [Shewanella sp. TC10]|uniref:hypothetical protein n=1 Tax=Shewanella sp. TC10 TaxID=1419739 RepID=UPI00129DD9A1|nr:hypothetical protein [Shewanella sp. TC10]
MNLEHILSQASEDELDFDVAVEFAKSKSMTLVEFVNLFAITLAKGYKEQVYDFEFSDSAANWLFGFLTEDVFLSSNNNALPSPAYDVYLAFDEGEYHHDGDSDEVVAEEKYTKPQIDQILSVKYS